MAERARVAVLISGRGSNMAALIEAAKAKTCAYRVVLVTGDNPHAPGLSFAEAEGIPVVRLPRPTAKDKSQFFELLDEILREAGTEYIALAGFMRLLPSEFIERWRGRILNIHPSLLPRHKGLDTHARALAAGDSLHGCSVHVVTEELDSGELLAQAEVPVLSGDDVETLAARVLAVEHRLYPKALAEFVAKSSCRT